MYDAAKVYSKAYKLASKLIPRNFRGQISWLRPENKPFLQIAHDNLLALIYAMDGPKAKAMAKKLLGWCPDDELGVRRLVPDIDFINGELLTALEAYVRLADAAPVHWYCAARCSLRTGDYVGACTHLRKGIAGNPYVAEALTGRYHLDEHLYWHESNLCGPHQAIEYLKSPVGVLTLEETDFVDWVFNASDVLRERAVLMAIREALAFDHDIGTRGESETRIKAFVKGIDDKVSRKMLRKITSRLGVETRPWVRAGRLTSHAS